MFSTLCRNFRSGVGTGWNFSICLFADSENIGTIKTTGIITIDLNGLMFELKLMLANSYKVTGNVENTDHLFKKQNFKKQPLINNVGMKRTSGI